MIPTPGAYLKCRRTAAGKSREDVAGVLSTDPRIAHHERSDWIMRIEADIAPASWTTIVALRQQFAFDLAVLERLSLIHLGQDLPPPRLCRICCASDTFAIGLAIMPWGWAAPDLCIPCTLPSFDEVTTA